MAELRAARLPRQLLGQGCQIDGLAAVQDEAAVQTEQSALLKIECTGCRRQAEAATGGLAGAGHLDQRARTQVD